VAALTWVKLTAALIVWLLLGSPTVAFAGQNILTWRDNSLNEKIFQIARKVGPCAATGTWYLRATVGPNVTTYTDTGLIIGAIYCYKVRATNATGVSMYSNQAEGTAKPSPTCGMVKSVAPDGTVIYTWVCH
jgi:hypothetical protein